MIYFSTKTGICHPVVEAAGGNLKALYALGTRSLELQSPARMRSLGDYSTPL